MDANQMRRRFIVTWVSCSMDFLDGLGKSLLKRRSPRQLGVDMVMDAAELELASHSDYSRIGAWNIVN